MIAHFVGLVRSPQSEAVLGCGIFLAELPIAGCRGAWPERSSPGAVQFSPIVYPRFSYRAPDVVVVLNKACAVIGHPATIRVDHGSEFVSRI